MSFLKQRDFSAILLLLLIGCLSGCHGLGESIAQVLPEKEASVVEQPLNATPVSAERQQSGDSPAFVQRNISHGYVQPGDESEYGEMMILDDASEEDGFTDLEHYGTTDESYRSMIRGDENMDDYMLGEVINIETPYSQEDFQTMIADMPLEDPRIAEQEKRRQWDDLHADITGEYTRYHGYDTSTQERPNRKRQKTSEVSEPNHPNLREYLKNRRS